MFIYAIGGIYAGHLAEKIDKVKFIFISSTLIGIVLALIGVMHRVGASHAGYVFVIL